MPLVGRRPARSIRTVLWFLAAAFLLAACAGSTTLPMQPGQEEPPGFFPTQPITDAGVATQSLYGLTFAIAVIVFIIVEGLLIYITLRYRRRPTDTGLPAQTHGSNPLEILWTLIPAITVTVLFVAALITLAEEHETLAAEPAVVVDVKGFQFQWQFDYPNEQLSFIGAGTEGPLMALPINETVRIRLQSSDVIHSFYVPQFLYKKDVVPGRINEFDVVVREPGTYAGQCAEFCGFSHAEMFFTVQAMPRPEYDAWVTAAQEEASATPQPQPTGATTVQVTSVSITDGFEPAELSVPADTPLTIELTNADPAAPHDFAIRGTPEGDWQGDPDAPGGGSAVYQAPALPAGEYEFYCSIHPNMVGTLQVGQ